MTHNNNQALSADRKLRLFTALWPEETIRQRIVDYRASQHWMRGVRTVSDANLHVTLTFLGDVSPALLPALTDRLGSMRCTPFELWFDRIEGWGDGLVVLCPQAIPAELILLHERLQAVQAELGLPVESRPYRPHITLARRAGGSVVNPPAAPIQWRVREFVLARSEPPGVYQVLHAFA